MMVEKIKQWYQLFSPHLSALGTKSNDVHRKTSICDKTQW